ncbi:hypothetical protein Q9966_007856 [Columba livia]|nr:hypothetical protein Q9966_007856 [Columba livia]
MHRTPEGARGAHVSQLPSFKPLLKKLRARNAAMTLHASSLERLVESQAKDLLALLQEHGPSTEGIFLLAAGERASRELREALDSGAQVQLESQPVHLLATIFQEFLRKIPSKLLQNELYQDWMSALQKTSRQERLAGLKEACLQLSNFFSSPLQDLLVLLQEHGPSMEEIFLLAARKCTSWLLWKALCSGAHVHLESQPVHLLAVILQVFLCKIPSQLLQTELYQDWKSALQKTSRQERLAGLMETPEGAGGAHVSQLPSFKPLLKELRARNAAMTLHASSLERLVESQAKDLLALLQEHGPSTEGIFLLAAGERASRELREALDSGAQVQLESQPVHLLATIFQEFLRKIPSKLLQNELYQDWMSALQKTSRQERLAGLKEACLQLSNFFSSPLQDLLVLLQEHGPSTEEIFLLAAGERASRELREALDSGAQVQLESQPVHLLATIFQEFLRKIPSKLLQNELYQDWMSALQKTSRQERLAGLKEACLQLSNFFSSPLQDLLVLLQEHGPSTEEIFLLAARKCTSWLLWKALCSGAHVHLEGQPVHLLAVILQVNLYDPESSSSRLCADGHLGEQEPKPQSCCSTRALGMLPMLVAVVGTASPTALAIAGVSLQNPLPAPPDRALPGLDERPAEDQQAGEASGANGVPMFFAAWIPWMNSDTWSSRGMIQPQHHHIRGKERDTVPSCSVWQILLNTTKLEQPRITFRAIPALAGGLTGSPVRSMSKCPPAVTSPQAGVGMGTSGYMEHVVPVCLGLLR